MTLLERALELRSTLKPEQQKAFDQLAQSRKDLGPDARSIWASEVILQAIEAGDPFEFWDLSQLQGVK